MTHAAVFEGGEMTVGYTWAGKAIGQTMFAYTPEAWLDWFHSMIVEMRPATAAGTKKDKVKVCGKRPPSRAPRSRRLRSRRRGSRRPVKA